MSVALIYNVKPESETFNESLYTLRQSSLNSSDTPADVFAEWDTWETIHAVKYALERYHDVSLVEANLLLVDELKKIKPDIVFNIAEGMFGSSREAQVPAILDMLNIPYSGSDPLTLALTLDKARTKEVLQYHDIPTAAFMSIEYEEDIERCNLHFPLIVKPNAEGSSKGIYLSSVVNNKEELHREVDRVVSQYNQPALVEEFLTGREFTVAILGNGQEAKVLPIIEIAFDQLPEDFIPVYSYEAKWIIDSKDHQLDLYDCPAKLTPELKKAIEEVCLRAYRILRCKDWSRIDVRLDDKGIPNIIEVNPLPGILPDPKENSCYPKAARTAGLDYDEMINSVLFAACKRYNLL